MYFPILRGKQFELIALRELAEKISPELMRPVIEPVRENLLPLSRTIEVLKKYTIKPLIIVNPNIGYFSEKNDELINFVRAQGENVIPCVKAKNVKDLSLIIDNEFLLKDCAVFIENGLDKALVVELSEVGCILINKEKVHPGALRLLKNVVLYGDFFDKKIRNADYQDKSFYSSLHTEWKSQGNVIGFGDYTILSEEYMDSGGPAYVVTIHLSYIDESEFDAMYVKHFSSFNDGSYANPGGKFKSALDKAYNFNKENPGVFVETSGLKELLALQGNPFPGLGQVKKYAMKHHIETICDYVGEA